MDNEINANGPGWAATIHPDSAVLSFHCRGGEEVEAEPCTAGNDVRIGVRRTWSEAHGSACSSMYLTDAAARELYEKLGAVLAARSAEDAAPSASSDPYARLVRREEGDAA